MTDSIRDLIADLIQASDDEWKWEEGIDSGLDLYQADAILECAEIRAIINIAADVTAGPYPNVVPSPEVRALLADWRNR